TTTGSAPVACMMPAAIAPEVLGIRPPREANHGAIEVTSNGAPAQTARQAATSLGYVNSGSAPISTAATRSASSSVARDTLAPRRGASKPSLPNASTGAPGYSRQRYMAAIFAGVSSSQSSIGKPTARSRPAWAAGTWPDPFVKHTKRRPLVRTRCSTSAAIGSGWLPVPELGSSDRASVPSTSKTNARACLSEGPIVTRADLPWEPPMKTPAAILTRAGQPMVIDELDLPDPGPTHVVVKQYATGVCHSQLHELA